MDSTTPEKRKLEDCDTIDSKVVVVPVKKFAIADILNITDDTANGKEPIAEDKPQQEIFKNLGCLVVDSVLSNSADYKRIVIEGTVGDQKAVVILDKKPFTEDILPELFSTESELVHTFQNDIYGSYDCIPTPRVSAVKATIVHPATPKHIDKYRIQPSFLIEETPDIYREVTLPYLQSSSFDIQWVFNILNHTKEKDRIVFEVPDPLKGFILLPDLKWDGETLSNLYLVAIIHQKGIKSLRDLTSEHVPLLENILEAGSEAIEEKYGLKKSQLRIYIHYQPSYYHLHVHFTALSFNAPGISTDKSHILQSVIGNIKLSPSYYQQATLPFVVKKGDQLYTRLQEHGYNF